MIQKIIKIIINKINNITKIEERRRITKTVNKIVKNIGNLVGVNGYRSINNSMISIQWEYLCLSKL
jgi:hypothetical protein